MTGMVLIQPVHMRFDTWTACGLKGVQHRPVRTTTVATGGWEAVSCKKCRKQMKPPVRR